MPVSEKTLEINMNNVKFSHGVMRGKIYLNLAKKSLLIGDNGAGKTSFAEFLKKNQSRLFGESVFFISQDELLKHEVLNGLDLKNILKNSINHRFVESRFDQFIESISIDTTILQKNIAILSGGERQLVKLALGFSVSADYYVIDEPFNNLSRDKRNLVRKFINEQTSGSLIIDHFHEEWVEEFTEKFLIDFDASDLLLKKVLND